MPYKGVIVVASSAAGTDFVAALADRDFDRLQTCFHTEVRFRALVPSGMREGSTAAEATSWVRKWFGSASELRLLSSSVEQIADRLHITYRFRVQEDGQWQMVEQQAYCIVDGGLIVDMHLLCSGFRPDIENQSSGDSCDMNDAPHCTESHADAFYDAGSRGCAEGPLDEVARLMRGLASGQTLEVHATDPSVVRDLPAWCRMVGHDLITSEQDRYLIRHK